MAFGDDVATDVDDDKLVGAEFRCRTPYQLGHTDCAIFGLQQQQRHIEAPRQRRQGRRTLVEKPRDVPDNRDVLNAYVA